MNFNLKLVLMYFVVTPIIFGALITNIFFSLLEVLGFKYGREVKLKCYSPIIALVALFVMLVYMLLFYHSCSLQ